MMKNTLKKLMCVGVAAATLTGVMTAAPKNSGDVTITDSNVSINGGRRYKAVPLIFNLYVIMRCYDGPKCGLKN